MLNTSWKNLSISASPVQKWRSIRFTDKCIKNTHFEAVASKWRLISPTLFCPPGANAFVNPLRLPKIGDVLYKKWKIQQLFLILLLLLSTCILGINAFRRDSQDQSLALALFTFLIFCIINYFASLNVESLAERSEYFSAVAYQPKKHFLFPIVIILISFAASQFYFGSFENAANSYGAIISNVRHGSVWRILTSSFIHFGISHWIINGATLLLLFPLISFSNLQNAILVFLLGTIGSQFAYVMLGILDLHSGQLMVGYSGGIFALLGYAFIDSIIDGDAYPNSFVWVISSFSLMCIVSAKAINPHASLIAHVSGFCIGVIYNFSRQFFNLKV